MMRLRHGLAALGVTVLAGTLAAQQPPAGGGQRGAAPPAEPPKNLQVMPKDTPRATVLQRMQGISQALGVQCGYCHVFEGPNNPANDFAADTKPAKEVARAMMRMTGEINRTLTAEIKKPADQLTQVGCMTCHRGAAIPVLPPPPARGTPPAAPSAPTAPGGAAPPAPPAPGR